MESLLEIKRALDSVRLTESLVAPPHPSARFFKINEWRGVLTRSEVAVLNEAFDKFLEQGPVLYPGIHRATVSQTIRAFNSFIVLEQRILSEAQGDEEVPKKKGLLGRAWDKVKGAGTALGRKFRSASLEKGGSLFGASAKSKGQAKEGEFISQSGIGQAMSAALGGHAKYFPNNDDFEEFKKDLESAIAAGFKYIKNPTNEKDKGKTTELLKDLKKWLVYQMDFKLGDYYKHFKGGSKKEESVDPLLSQGSLRSLLEAEKSDKKEDEKNEYELGTSRKESGSWQGLESKTLPKILAALGFIAGGVAFKMLSDAFSGVTNFGSRDVLEQVSEKAAKPFDVPMNFKDGLDRGLAEGMKSAGFDPSKASSVKAFYSAMDGDNPGSFAEKLADAAGKTGKNKELFVKYLQQQMEKGTPPLNMGYSEGSLPGFKGIDMTGTTMKSPLGMPPKSITLKGALTKMIVKTVVTKVISGVTVASGAGAAGGAALLGAGAGAIIAAGVIMWLRSRSKTESRLAILAGALDKIDAEWEKATGKPADPIAVPQPQTPPPPQGGGVESGEDADESDRPPFPTEDAAAAIAGVLGKLKLKSGKKINVRQSSNKLALRFKKVYDAGKTDDGSISAVIANLKLSAKTKSRIVDVVKEYFVEGIDTAEEEEVEEKPQSTTPAEKEKKPSDEDLEADRDRLMSRVTDSYKRSGFVMTERWMRLAGLPH